MYGNGLMSFYSFTGLDINGYYNNRGYGKKWKWHEHEIIRMCDLVSFST